MLKTWKHAFKDSKWSLADESDRYALHPPIRTLPELKSYLDIVHAKICLLKPFFEESDYPLVEARELLPSFETDPFEYENLPGFSMVAFERPLEYFEEIFQFDILHSLLDQSDTALGVACPLETTVLRNNIQTLQNRLPKRYQDALTEKFSNRDVTDLDHYHELLPFLLQMDRAHVLARDMYQNFILSGVYGSFPSDLDTEIKRFGLRIGKFTVGDSLRYELNRIFVYQFLMELYGFPIVSERRTSAALFARKLHKLGERFLVRVLGQSDRTVTTLYSEDGEKHYPRLEKLALVRVEKEQKDVIRLLEDGGYFIDPKRLVVLVRVRYKQHKFNPHNVRQDRALSVENQEVIHPITGRAYTGLNIIKDATNMFLRLNDIVRGEYVGRIVFKRNEIVENTDTDEKRLKFLYAWLSKHQRRIISYSDEFYAKVVQVLDHYLLNPENYDVFQDSYELYHEVWAKYSYIQQARKVRHLEEISDGLDRKGKRISHRDRLKESCELLHELKFEIVNYFEDLVQSVIGICETMLSDRYLVKTYVEKKDEELTDYGRSVKRYYGKLVALLDEFKSIRKSRAELLPSLLETG
ncbi:hypothetical protein DPQ33_14835 [Oceanidesulfovibrio indonesiensis]|uniref:Uncharacterized protein n=1 Tax=Oceanidesulfovibrio indonesiensis TaxID=54767 RepID=A0A7M3MCR0_9BACT|nr:hypothetical protein [Oceanidesulfovibrio indonesiensis]TVM15668.1 hypothetical protein DPQ33_14835 [Oceanidesulfovibrio indonesiensis]